MLSTQPRPARGSESAVSAVDKKRERKREIDRISQHRKRQKDRERITQLEEQLKCLRRPYDNCLMASLLDKQKKHNIRAVRHRERLEQIQALLKADADDFEERPTEEAPNKDSEASTRGQNGLPQDQEISSSQIPGVGTITWPDFLLQGCDTLQLDILGSTLPMGQFPLSSPNGDGYIANTSPNVLDPGLNSIPNALATKAVRATCFPGDMKCPKCYGPWKHVHDLIHKARVLNQQSIGSRVSREDFDVHVIVLAVAEGWSTVKDQFQLDPHLECLQWFDVELFSAAGEIDRLSILWALHRMLKYQDIPFPASLEYLPSFMCPRPCQMQIPHVSIADYFVWPGFREHMVFNHEKYCSNTWAWSFVASYHFLWPFEIHDAYNRNTNTSFYRLSTSFLEAANDLRSYTLDSSFINMNPEFLGDVAQFDSIYPQLNGIQDTSKSSLCQTWAPSNDSNRFQDTLSPLGFSVN